MHYNNISEVMFLIKNCNMYVLRKEYLELHTDLRLKGWKSRHKTESEGGVIRRASEPPTHQLAARAYSGFRVRASMK